MLVSKRNDPKVGLFLIWWKQCISWWILMLMEEWSYWPLFCQKCVQTVYRGRITKETLQETINHGPGGQTLWLQLSMFPTNSCSSHFQMKHGHHILRWLKIWIWPWTGADLPRWLLAGNGPAWWQPTRPSALWIRRSESHPRGSAGQAGKPPSQCRKHKKRSNHSL